MPPTLILIRHAQALHNVNQDYTIPDPPLSELGRSQCQELSQNLQAKLPADLESSIGLIVTSAMRRTCETTALSLGWLLDRGVPAVAHAGWQENSAKACDTGSPLPAVAAEFPRFDFSQVDPLYPDKTSPAAAAKYGYRRDRLVARAQAALGELHARPERTVVVVSHSGFMRQAVTGDHYFNADYRIYDFEERAQGEEGPFKLRQWDLTKGAGGMGRSNDQIVEIGVGLPEADLAPGEDIELPAGVIPN